MRSIVLFFLCFGMLSIQAKSLKLKVVTTIKPITLLVYEIGGKEVEISQLIPDSSSVHHYSFKPSDLRKIKQASIFFRIDEHLESIFNPILDKMRSSFSVISLAEESERIELLPISGENEESHGHHHDSHHDHGNVDLHIWSSPKNAIEMARTISKELSKKDPENATFYQKNFLYFSVKTNKKIIEIKKQLDSKRNNPYVVFHNSWRYFQESFELHNPIIIGLDEGTIPGVKSIFETRKKIRNSNVKCVFKDLSINEARVRTLTEGFDIKTVEIDSLASRVKLEKNGYIDWLSYLQRQVFDCLNY